MSEAPLLLDTCAAIWVSQGEEIADAAVDAVQRTETEGAYIYVSPIPACVACSNACASCRTPTSSRCRPTIWTPTGSPPSVKPAGTEIAGRNVALIQYADCIHAM